MNVQALVWLTSTLLGVIVWLWNLYSGWLSWLRQARAGENGSLRETVLTTLRSSLLGLASSLCGIAVLFVALGVDDVGARMQLARWLLVGVSTFTTLMGVQIAVDRVRVLRKIRADLIAARAAGVEEDG